MLQMQSWKELRVGDRIRIVGFPSDWMKPGYKVPTSIRAIYRKLIERKCTQRIYEIDNWGAPWFRLRLRNSKGKLEQHYMTICEDDGWIRVKARI